MGPAAGISFAVLRINRATLRLDPRVGPPPCPPSPACLSSASLDLSINLLLSSLCRASNTDVRDSSLLRRRRRRVGRRDGRRLRRRCHANSPSSASTLVRNSRDTARERERERERAPSQSRYQFISRERALHSCFFPQATQTRVKKRTRAGNARRTHARTPHASTPRDCFNFLPSAFCYAHSRRYRRNFTT